MERMNVQEMHERLMLYKMVRQVVEKKKSETTSSPWLCNLYEYANEHKENIH